MLNKLASFLREYDMIRPGDTVICAVSGGADSVALLFGLYLLKEKLDITLEAAHYNHHLRGEESDRDERFVRDFCDRYDIPLHIGGGTVTAGKKGLEAAAREARYSFLRSLPGKIATAHTADDNAETVLLHLIRGTGLKGLGGVTPVSGNVIRPMLAITRQDVEGFLEEWCLKHIQDSSNDTDQFLRNRLRHHVMPLLKAENPRLAENLSAMALRLREDEEYLARQAECDSLPGVEELRRLHPAVRGRMLEWFLKDSGVREPEQTHLASAEALVFSDRPSARCHFPGGVTITRNYDRLEKQEEKHAPEPVILSGYGEAEYGPYRISCTPAEQLLNGPDVFTVIPEGPVRIGCRESGDRLRLPGGSKSLKKLYIDRKIPAGLRPQIPVVRDDRGILGVCGVGPDQDRKAEGLPAVTVRIREK